MRNLNDIRLLMGLLPSAYDRACLADVDPRLRLLRRDRLRFNVFGRDQPVIVAVADVQQRAILRVETDETGKPDGKFETKRI